MGGRPGRRGGGHGGLWFWNVAHPLGTAPGWWIGLAAGIGQTAVFGGGGGPLQLPVGQGDPGSSSCPHYTPGPCSPEAGGGVSPGWFGIPTRVPSVAVKIQVPPWGLSLTLPPTAAQPCWATT